MVKGIITEKIVSHLLIVCLESFQINSVIKNIFIHFKIIFKLEMAPFVS